MKIKAKNSKVVSMKLIVPIDGLIDIDGNGIADVSPKCAVQLVNSTNDWEYLKKNVPEKEAEDIDEDDDELEDENEESSERDAFQEGLKAMKLEEMKDVATEAGYPEEEWKKLTSKKLMSAYLMKKFDEM